MSGNMAPNSNTVTAPASTNIVDTAKPVIGSLLVTAGSDQTDIETKKKECLEMCRSINSVAPGIMNYWSENRDLSDAFMVFSLYDKLRLTEVLLQSIIFEQLDRRVFDAQLSDNIEVDSAKRNLKLMFENFDNTIKRLRDIAPTLNTIAPVPPVHPPCGIAHVNR